MTRIDFQAKHHRFTLIEILTVIGIVLLLSAMAIGISSMTSQKQNEAKTKATLQKIQTALQTYKQEHGYYPRTDETKLRYRFPFGLNNDDKLFKPKPPNDGNDDDGDGKDDDCLVLTNNPKYAIPETNTSNNIDDDGDNVTDDGLQSPSGSPEGEDKYLRDGWGHYFFYECPGTMNPQKYDLWSMGKDKAPGQAGKNDDSSGGTDNPSEAQSSSAAKNSDDISNFSSY